MADASLFTMPEVGNSNLPMLLGFFVILEWAGREDQYGIQRTGLNRSRLVRWIFYALLIAMIGLFMRTKEAPFIYFQF
jgi:hypothetical protein